MKWQGNYRMRLAGSVLVVGILVGWGTTQSSVANESPVADAGLPRYTGRAPVQLDGSRSYDPDESGPLSYTWTQVDGPSVLITDENTATPTIDGFVQADEIQECQFELVVSDGDLTSLPDSVKVIIVPDFGVNKLIHLNPPFDPNKPTLAAFGGAGGCQNIKDGTYLTNYEEWRAIANFISFGNFHASIYKDLGDMFIVYLSSQAPDYKQPIQTFGHSAGGEPAIDIAIYLNETYADRRYAVNHVTLIDSAGYCRDYSGSIERFLASSVDGEQCWIDNYLSTLPGAYGMKRDFGFQSNVLNVWFDRTTDNSFTHQQNHQLSKKWYRESLTGSDMNEFNNGVVAGAYWSVIGPGKNLQLASTPDVETYKFTWYGDEFSGYMEFYDEANHPGRLPEPVTLVGPSGGSLVGADGVVLSCEVSENASGYQLLLGYDPYHMVYLVSDTPSPPSESVTSFPFEQTWWTVRAYDPYGSTIYADPLLISAESVRAQTIENVLTGQTYASIQQAINDAHGGDEIVVSAGACHFLENLDLKGKSLTIRSTDPNDPDVVAATVIHGKSFGPVVTFSAGLNKGGVLAGLTIAGGEIGISCEGMSPTIRSCTVGSGGSVAVEYWEGCEPRIIDSTVLGHVEEVDDPTLIAHWALDETEGDVAYDSVGTEDGTVLGNPLWEPEGGTVNGALAFDGVGDRIAIRRLLNPADGPFSVLAWIKGGEPGQVIVSQADGANWLMVDVLEGTLATELVPPARRVPVPPLVSDAVITDGLWHRVAFVWDGANRSLYVDGTLVAQDEQSSLAESHGVLNIGCGATLEPGSFFSGLIDDVRLYNRAVSP